MASHENTKNTGIEVDKLLGEFTEMKEDVAEKLKKISCVLNTNAFEMGIFGPEGVEKESSPISLRVIILIVNHCIEF